jgi:hypothetical protein
MADSGRGRKAIQKTGMDVRVIADKSVEKYEIRLDIGAREG